jgi:hypothetical protein
MAIELEVLTGTHLVTKQEITFPRYKILDRTDKGRFLIGYIDFDSTHIMFLNANIDPQYQKLVEIKVAQELKKAEDAITASLPPEQPEEYLNPTTDKGLITDEFDESDLT